MAADTVVFIPAWNEERSLPAVLDELRDGLPGADVLVIDDGSTDETAAVARARDCKGGGNGDDECGDGEHDCDRTTGSGG